ncbi:MAG: TIGR04282 family arsenosugar biosynthesis glycosyltransferase [Nitrosospira sp.]|nr:TIGR04282 family arsenosugar biosynthesis glycosyltransferase [Nitrosospira sp.]
MKPLRIIIFAKAPQAGICKTRLIPALGADGAAMLARRLLDHTLMQAMSAGIGTVELCMTPDDDELWQNVPLPVGIVRSVQGDGDLGQRLARTSQGVIERGETVLLIGTDCPALDAACLRHIASALVEVDAVMVPTADGGYAALGLNHFHQAVFSNIAWSTDSVAFETLCRFGGLGWSVQQLPMLHDVDEPTDLKWLPCSWPEASDA